MYDEIEIENTPTRWSKETTLLRKKEVFETGAIINALHYPLSNGDIFKLGAKEYILLVQPCNVALRNEGKRSNNFELATLVQILSKEQKSNSEKIPAMNKWVKFPSNYSLKLDVLDLAVFNNDGVCRIKLDKELDEKILFQDSLKTRYEKLRAVHSKCATQLNALQELLDTTGNKQYQFLLKPQITLDSSFKGLPQKPFNKQGNEFNFGIQRVTRLKEPYAAHMLQQFMLYLSRNAFDHDYSKND
jgi:hypothetical protein